MKRTISFLFALLALIGLGTTVANAATWYGIYVGETRVTDENANDILGDGQFKYNASTKTLTVTNATLTNSGSLGSGISNREVDGLTIKFVGNSTFTTRNNALHSQKSLTITGTGSLTASSSESSAFQLGGDGTVCTIEGPELEFSTTSTAAPLKDYNSSYTLNLKGSGTRLVLNPRQGYAAISNLKALTLSNGVYFTEPVYGYFSPSLKSVTTNGNTAYKGLVEFSNTPGSYGLSVCGREVTTANADDIFSYGTVSFNPSTKTLTMKSGGYQNLDQWASLGELYRIAGAGIVNNEIDGLIVKVEGEVMLSCLYPIVSLKSLSFTGSGTLYGQFLKDQNDLSNLYAQAGLSLLGNDITCTINGPKVYIFANAADGLSIGTAIFDYQQNATVRVEGSSSLLDLTPGYDYAAIEGLGSLQFGDGLIINKPLGGFFDYSLKSITTDGTTAYKGQVSIGQPEGYGIYVAETEVTTINLGDILGDGQFSYDPESKTLTVTNASLYNSGTMGSGISNREVDGLVIKLVGNSLFKTRMNVISSQQNFTITGGGTLTGESFSSSALYLCGDHISGTIEDVKVNLTGTLYCVKDYMENNTLIVNGNNTSVAFTNANPNYPTIYGLSNLILDNGLSIVEPSGAYFDNRLKSITTDGSTAYNGTIVIETPKPEEYGLTIAGRSINSGNAADILGDGSLRYDAASRTLTMENATLRVEDVSGIINEDVENLTLCVNGKNSIYINSNEKSSVSAIITNHPMTVKGYGILNITSEGKSFGIAAVAPVTIDGPRIKCSSEQIAWLAGVLSRDGELTIEGAYTQLILSSGEDLPPFVQLKSLTLGNDLYITQPYGGYFETELGAITTDGENYYTGTVVISNTPAQKPRINGDANGDGKVDVADITTIINIIGNK